MLRPRSLTIFSLGWLEPTKLKWKNTRKLVCQPSMVLLLWWKWAVHMAVEIASGRGGKGASAPYRRNSSTSLALLTLLPSHFQIRFFKSGSMNKSTISFVRFPRAGWNFPWIYTFLCQLTYNFPRVPNCVISSKSKFFILNHLRWKWLYSNITIGKSFEY